mmetsp:Transcript_3579/g.8781  ORF Transcript_3579/g.8781 Transcript_3579/m.8781 type:complete len:267 (-) Transcript_3579:185-985(-)
MVADVPRIQPQCPCRRIHLSRRFLRDLTVLHDLGSSSLSSAQDADGLIRTSLGDHLRTAIGILLYAVSNEQRICRKYKGVVDRAAVDVADTAFAHVLQCSRVLQGAVDPAIAVWSPCHLAGRVHQDIAGEVQARQRALLEEEDVRRPEPEEVVLGKERLGLLVRHWARHHIPGDRAAAAAADLPEPHEPLRHELEERLLGGQADVIAPLGVCRAQASPLPPRQKQVSNPPSSDEGQTFADVVTPLLCREAREVRHFGERVDSGELA